jgi:hypothetical protein
MKLPIRFRVRTILVVVGLVALVLGTAIAWVNHRELDHALEFEAMLFRQIAWHQHQANYCREAEASGLPYSRKDRLQLFAEHAKIFRSLNYSLPDWPTEARLHDDWASGLRDGAEVLHEKNLASQSSLSIR